MPCLYIALLFYASFPRLCYTDNCKHNIREQNHNNQNQFPVIQVFIHNTPIQQSDIRFANLALISGRQMHCINACIFLVAITKRRNAKNISFLLCVLASGNGFVIHYMIFYIDNKTFFTFWTKQRKMF